MTRDSCSPLAAAPLNLANSPSLHLLTPAEQTLCSQLRILPKPYLVIKETLVREYARRGGKLRRREARELVKIDVNKTSRVWDFLVQSGYLKITTDPSATASVTPSVSQQDGKCVHISLSRAVPRSTDLYSPTALAIPPVSMDHLRKSPRRKMYTNLSSLRQCRLLRAVRTDRYTAHRCSRCPNHGQLLVIDCLNVFMCHRTHTYLLYILYPVLTHCCICILGIHHLYYHHGTARVLPRLYLTGPVLPTKQRLHHPSAKFDSKILQCITKSKSIQSNQ